MPISSRQHRELGPLLLNRALLKNGFGNSFGITLRSPARCQGLECPLPFPFCHWRLPKLAPARLNEVPWRDLHPYTTDIAGIVFHPQLGLPPNMLGPKLRRGVFETKKLYPCLLKITFFKRKEVK